MGLKIVVAVDLSDAADKVIRVTEYIAKATQAKVRVLNRTSWAMKPARKWFATRSLKSFAQSTAVYRRTPRRYAKPAWMRLPA